MATELPEVHEQFVADVSPFVAAVMEAAGAVRDLGTAVEEVQAQIDALHGKTIEIGIEATAGAAQAAAAAVNDLTGAEDRLSAASRLQVEWSAQAAREAQDMAGTFGILTETYARNAETVGLLRDATAALALGEGDAGAGAGRLGTALGAAGAAAGVAAGGLTFFGIAAGTLFHWVVAVGAEFLAVAIPATVALGAAMAVAAQGAQNVQTHMSALYTATEATANQFHQTIGSALGLRSALQQAQDAANPIVYSVLGAAVTTLKGNFMGLASAGLEVMRIFQTFAAQVVQDFSSGGMGGQIHALLSSMVTDLVMFAQILGNVGHALIGFAAAMPGLAEVLLRIVDGATQVILWVSKLPAVLITVAFAMEETWRWGGALVGILTRIPVLFGALLASGFGIVPVFARVAEIFRSLLLLGPGLATALGVVMTRMTLMPAAFQEAGASIALFGAEAQAAIAGLSTWQLALGAVAVGGLTFLVIKALTARTAVQQLGDAMQQTVDKASGLKVFGDIASNLGTLNAMQAQSVAAFTRQSQAIGHQVMEYGKVTVAMGGAAQAAASFNGPIQQQQRDLLNAAQAATFLTQKYGVSFVGALQLGTQAGIQWDAGIGKMSATAELNLIKVQNLIHGYQLMGQSAGQVGKDMTVIGLESALQATQIGKLTQAWQTYMGQLTGGTTGLATFEQGLANIGTVAASTAGRLFEAQGKMNESTQRFAQSLASFTGKAAQNWQNFNQVVTTGAQNFITWMQTAGAMGVVSGNQMTGAIKGIVAQMIPFATHSAAARAELSGLALQANAVVPPTTRALEAFAKGGMSAKQLAQFVQQATARMADMAAVAAHLGAVMQSDLVSMFDKAKIAASGLPGDLNSLSNAIQRTGVSSGTTHGQMIKVAQDLLNLHTSIPTVAALMNTMGISISAAGVKALVASGQLHQMGGSATAAGGQARSAAGNVNALVAAINALHSKSITITTYYQSVGLGSRFGHTGTGPLQSGTAYATPGLHLVGEVGPELVMFAGGERVLSNPQTRQFLSGVRPANAGLPVAPPPAPVPQGPSTLVIQMNSREVARAVMPELWRWMGRNQGQVTGVLKPA